MSWVLHSFRGNLLPRYDARWRISGRGRDTVRGALMGVVDLAGNAARPPVERTVDLSAVALPEPGQYTADLIDFWRSEEGQVGALVMRSEETREERQCLARLIEAPFDRDARRDHAQVRVSMRFALLDQVWTRAQLAAIGTVATNPGTAQVWNWGNAVYARLKLDVKANGGTITDLTISIGSPLTSGIRLSGGYTWAATNTVTIDCGAWTVAHLVLGDWYNYLSLATGHKTAEWLPIPPGGCSLNFAWSGTATSLAVTRTAADAWV